MRLGYVIHYVEDVLGSCQFFEAAFGFSTRYLDENLDYAELETGATVLSFASYSLGDRNLPDGYKKTSNQDLPLGVEIALVAKDVDLSYRQALDNGAIELCPPEKKPWGQTVSYIQSPQGILIEICSEMP